MGQDQRSVGTKTQLREALLVLAKNKPIEKISVKDLCETAKVNRTTFYYHYKVVEDILTDIQDEMENELITFLTNEKLYENGAPRSKFYEGIYSFISKNSDVCTYILCSSHDAPFLIKALELGRAKVFSSMADYISSISTPVLDFYYVYVSNGIISLIRKWLMDGMVIPIPEIASLTMEITSSALDFISNAPLGENR